MNEIITSTPATSVVMRSGSAQVREVEVGETLTVGNHGSISVAGDHAGALIEGNRVTFAEPGRYTVRHVVGQFDVLAYEPTALDRVPRRPSSGSSEDRSDAERRLVLRSLATHSEWNGTSVDAGRFNLMQFGA